jgi:hypothetical protein
MSTFEGTCGGESPARPALPLILDGRYGTCCSPVNGVSGSSGLNFDLPGSGLIAEEAEHLFVFNSSYVSELVDADGGSL